MHAFSVSRSQCSPWHIWIRLFRMLVSIDFYGRSGACNMYYYYYYLPHSNCAVSHIISIRSKSRHLDGQFILINGASACTNQIGFVRVVSVKASNSNCCVHAVNFTIVTDRFFAATHECAVYVSVLESAT